MRLIKTPEHRPWPKFTTDMLVAEGDPKPVFVMPVLVQRDDEEVAWHSVHIRIGGLEGQQGAVYNSHTPAVAKEKADQLRTAADNAGATGMVPFKVELNKAARRARSRPGTRATVTKSLRSAVSRSAWSRSGPSLPPQVGIGGSNGVRHSARHPIELGDQRWRGQ